MVSGKGECCAVLGFPTTTMAADVFSFLVLHRLQSKHPTPCLLQPSHSATALLWRHAGTRVAERCALGSAVGRTIMLQQQEA